MPDTERQSPLSNMAATDAGRLLSTLCGSDGFGDQWWTTFISLFRLELRNYFSFLKLVIKPDSLLLEDRRTEVRQAVKDTTREML